MITEIIIEMVRMSCLREESMGDEFMQWLCIFGVVIIIIVDAIKWPHPCAGVS